MSFGQPMQGKKTIEHYEKLLDLWKDADLCIAEVGDAEKRVAAMHLWRAVYG